jgi:hypothetical protein
MPVDNSADPWVDPSTDPSVDPTHKSLSATRGSSAPLRGVVAERYEGGSGERPKPLVEPSSQPSSHPISVESRRTDNNVAQVWVERPGDEGSAVWGCTTCQHGAWCSDHTSATIEARLHAQGHGVRITLLNRPHGPKPQRDDRIRALSNQGLSTRAIAAAIGITHAGVAKALRRIRTNA